MTFLFDNLNAAIIGIVVTLMVVSLQSRIREMNLEQNATYMVKRDATSLAHWLEYDLERMGRDVAVDVPFGNPVDSSGVTTEFQFFRDTVYTHVTPYQQHRIFIRLKLKKQGVRVLRDTTLSVYQLTREQKIDAGGVWTVKGQSSGLMSSFKIELLNRDGKPVSTPATWAMSKPDTVRNTRVRFTMATPFETSQSAIRQVYYGSTLLIRE